MSAEDQTILLIGASGLVGHTYMQECGDGHVIPFTSKDVDITDIADVRRVIRPYAGPETTVINMAAYTNVDGAEKEKARARDLNTYGARNVARAAYQEDCGLLQVSTDFVFAGHEDNPGPYPENATPSRYYVQRRTYHSTKLEGEIAAQEEYPNAAIARIASPYSPHRHPDKSNLARGIVDRYYQTGLIWDMWSDLEFTPTYLPEASRAMRVIARHRMSGIFHIASSNVTTPHAFAVELLNATHGAGHLVPEGSIHDFHKDKERALRPIHGGLLTLETQRQLGREFMTVQEGIADFARRYELDPVPERPVAI